MPNFQEVVSSDLAPNDAIAADHRYQQEKRKRVRTTVHWPVLFFRNHSADGIESTTLNLSSSGFYCLSGALFTAGESLFCTLRVPSHDPAGNERIWILECRVRVK